MRSRARVSLLLVAAAALPAAAATPERDRPEAGITEAAVAAAPMAPAPGGDCSFAGAHDPDGALGRRERAKTTHLFARSHPSTLAQAPSSSLPGISGVRVRIPRVNFVDDEIFSALDAAGVAPAPLASDAEFLRRVTLDLTGRIPDASAVTAFLADGRADKRTRAVDQLLASDVFVDRWAQFFDDHFRNTAFADSGRLYSQGRNKFHSYLADSIRQKKPYDLMVREMLAAAGDNTTVGQANFKVRNIQTNGPQQDTYDNLASDVGRAFLGVDIFCTSCHHGAGHTDTINLYLSTVKRSDFWGVSAFFARSILRRQGTTPGDYYYTVGERPNGDYQLNTTTGNKTTRDGTWANGATVITPKYLFGGTPQAGETYTAAVARLVTADPQFARATVNYLWKEMFTAGIVEPAESFDLLRMDPSNPPPEPWGVQPTHPVLLNRLADAFAGSGYDLRAALRLMATSSAYQLSSYYPGEWDDAYAPYFARRFARRLRAEEVLDAITKATNVPASLPVAGYSSPVLWAGQLPDTQEPQGQRNQYKLFLDTFLRGDRDGQPRSDQGSISQALVSLNDRIVTDRVRSTANSSVGKLIAAKATPEVTVKTLYLATLSRPPSSGELAEGVARFQNLAAGQTVTSVTEDLQFVLLNKLDFLFNY